MTYTLAGHFGPMFIGGYAGLSAAVYEHGTGPSVTPVRSRTATLLRSA